VHFLDYIIFEIHQVRSLVENCHLKLLVAQPLINLCIGGASTHCLYILIGLIVICWIICLVYIWCIISLKRLIGNWMNGRNKILLWCVLLWAVYASVDLETYIWIILLIDFRIIKAWNIYILVLSIVAKIFISLSCYHVVKKAYLILIIWNIIKCAFMYVKILSIAWWYFPASVRLKSNVFLDKRNVHIFLRLFQAEILIIVIKYWNHHFIEVWRLEIILGQKVFWIIRVYFDI
jgi:hypothetical protein